MDPLSANVLTQTITALLGAAASEAGKRAWDALTGLVHRAFGRDTSPARMVTDGSGLEPGELAGALSERASQDPEFAAALDAWYTRTARDLSIHRTTQVISGTVTGTAIQADTINGSITIGTDSRARP